MNESEKERLIKKDMVSIENRVRHAFNQGYEMGLKENKSEIPTGCGDAISRQAVLNTLDNMDKALDEDRTVENYKELLKECYEVLPSVSPKQRAGQWIQKEEEGEAEPFIIWECSECSETQKRRTKHCPDCGCKMQEVEE